MGYSKYAIIGVSWTSAFRIITRGIAFLRIAALGRILSPVQFGIFGIGSLVLAFIEIITETGINIFLIQEEDGDDYINTAWIVSIVRGCIISLVILVSASFIANFFNTPDATRLLMLISIVPFIRGFINPAIIRLQKNLEFNKEFYFRSIIFFVDSCIAVIATFITQSAVGIVWGLIVGAIVEVLLSFIIVKPKPRFLYKKKKMFFVINRGKWVTVSGIFQYLSEHGDDMVVGKLLGTASLGIYQMGYKISTLPITEITDVISKVSFPIYAKIAHDKKRLLRAFIFTTFLITIGVICIGTVFIIYYEQLVLILLGKKWMVVTAILPILIWYGVVRAIFGSTSALFLAVKKQEYVASMTLVRLLTLAITIMPLTTLYGLIGVSYAALFSALIEIPLIGYYTVLIFTKDKNETS